MGQGVQGRGMGQGWAGQDVKSFKRVSNLALLSDAGGPTAGLCAEHRVAIVGHTSVTATPQEWLAEVEFMAHQSHPVRARERGEGPEQERREDEEEVARDKCDHSCWWKAFWRRSWMHIDNVEGEGGGGGAKTVERGFALERFVTALAGRGKYPIKFNGNVFTTENPPFDPDYRQWGGMYWFQNTRWAYWSMLVSGDVEMMSPFFHMYLSSLPLHARRTRQWFGHGGAYFPETQHFWGSMGDGDYGCARAGKPVWKVDNAYIRHYVTPGLELVAMALDALAFTEKATFGRQVVLPLADAVLTFFDLHYSRDVNGMLVLAPSQALETYQSAINPAPDVAGLTHVLQELLVLPDAIFQGAEEAAEYKEKWQQLLDVVPDLPVAPVPDSQCQKTGLAHSDPWASPDQPLVLAPAEAWSPAARNYENPALYSVFPFRLFQVGKQPRVNVPMHSAAAAFNLRPFPCNKGWCSDAVQAAHLGAAEVAAHLVQERFASPTLKFPAFFERSAYLLHLFLLHLGREARVFAG